MWKSLKTYKCSTIKGKTITQPKVCNKMLLSIAAIFGKYENNYTKIDINKIVK